MAYLLQSNLAKSTLAEGINDAVTSLTVATGEGAKFPATGDFICIIHDSTGETNVEYVKCTGRTTDALTITRQTEDSTRYPACAHALGSVIGLVISAGTLTEMQDAIDDKIADVSDDTTPTLGGPLQMIEEAILLDAALSADGKYSGVCEVGVGGAAIAFGKMVYFNSAGKWVVTDANAEATTKGRIGMCVVACGGDTQSITVMFLGKVREDDWNWATVGAPLFLDTATTGGLTLTAPSGTADCVRVAGFVIDADTVFVQPSQDWLEIV